jgi:hypothetical protein
LFRERKVCRSKDSCRCDLWPWCCDLETEIPFRSISPKRMKIFCWYWGRLFRETKVCRVKDSCRCNHWPWSCDLETEIPFRSISPKRMNIFGWCLVGGCIRGAKRCVTRNICVDATFDLDPVTLKPKFHSTPYYLLNEWRFLVDIGGRLYQGTKVCRAKDSCRCDLWPWSWDLETEITFCSISPKRMKIFGWYLVDIWWAVVSGEKGVLRERFVSMRPLILWPWDRNSLPFHIS